MATSSANAFVVALRKEMAASRDNDFSDNYDTHHLGSEPAAKQTPMWRLCLGEIADSVRRLKNYYFAPEAYFQPTATAYEDVAFLHNLLVDEASKNLVVKLCAYRALGHRKVRLPRSGPNYKAGQDKIKDLVTDADPFKIDFMDHSLVQYDCSSIGYNMRPYATAGGLACALVQKQYEFKEDVYGYACKAEAGDIVIDAGACWGETTLYFAHEVGADGKVIAFEFIPSNLKVFNKNLEANPDLADRITLVDRPIWRQSGLELYYVDWGPGSRVTSDDLLYKYDGVCRTISIDDMVEQQGLPRVDFIKMDIEGAEFPALRGAERTIRAHRPKLAISIYHQMSDFTTIPRYLYELGLTYDFFLDHHTLYENETVLFAIPRGRVREI